MTTTTTALLLASPTGRLTYAEVVAVPHQLDGAAFFEAMEFEAMKRVQDLAAPSDL